MGWSSVGLGLPWIGYAFGDFTLGWVFLELGFTLVGFYFWLGFTGLGFTLGWVLPWVRFHLGLGFNFGRVLLWCGLPWI